MRKPNRAKSASYFSVFMAMLAVFGLVVAVSTSVSFAQQADAEKLVSTDANNEAAIYLVRLQDPPLALYRGGINGIAPTSPVVNNTRGLDLNSQAVQAYSDHLATQRANFVTEAQTLLGRNLDVVYEYAVANNGMAVWLTPTEAAQVAKIEGVIFIKQDEEKELHTDNGPEWIGAPVVWDGSSVPSGMGTFGEGTVVGIIDTGINYSNPSFAEVGPIDGYVHTNPLGSGNFIGNCAPSGGYESYCNDKLIGVRGYATVNGGDPVDYNGHGSHVGGTAAGNFVTATVSAPTTTITRTISGVAPHANLIAYSACCTESALTAAIEDIVLDYATLLAADSSVRMSVNYSIGSPGATPDMWNDFDTAGYLAARDAGIFVATSAGNNGPGASTVGSPADAPWLTSVGNSTHNRVWSNNLIDMSGGDTAAPANISGKGLTSGYGSADIVYAGDFPSGSTSTPQLCGVGTIGSFISPWPAGTFNGEIVVCDRGTYGRVEMGANVLAAGAGGYVLANHAAAGNALVGDAHELPGVHITYADGVVLKAWLASGTGHMATITGSTINEDPSNGDIMSSSSSRGPNRALPDIISPNVTAPGTDILAPYGVNNAIAWDMISGTSMASPHVAGAAALLMATYPDWTPAQVQSALMLTAWQDMLKEDGATPADPFDMGSGRIDLNVAALTGLVMDETTANYENANPAIGGDPKTLNLPSMGNASCVGQCSWTRSFQSVLSTPATYTITFDVPVSMTMTASPAVFTINPGATQVVEFTANVSDLPVNVHAFGTVVLETDASHSLPLPPGVDFVELGEAYDRADAWTQKTHDISAYANQEVCFAFRHEGSDSHSWRIDDILVTSDSGTHLDESFDDTTFPPTGWAYYQLGNNPQRSWVRSVTTPNTAPAAAFYNWNNASNHDDGWLVTPPLTLGDNPELTYFDRVGFLSFYTYSGVWISTGSCDPSPIPGVEAVDNHLPVMVVPTAAILPSAVSIETMFRTGSVDVTDLIAGEEITDLTVEYGGLFAAQMVEEELNQDPTRNDPYNNLAEVFYMTVTVPADTVRLIAEILESEAPDLDLFVGTGDTPSAATEECFGATASWNEYCAIENPAPGTWWILVQNWGGSANQPDAFTLAGAVVTDMDAGNMTVDGPATVAPGTPFDLTVNWDEPALMVGEKWYGFFTLGTDAGNPGNLGTVWVDLLYTGAATASVDPTVTNSQTVGMVMTGTLHITNTGDVPLTWNISEEAPAPAMAVAPASAPAFVPDMARLTGLTAEANVPAVATAPRTINSTVLWEQVVNGTSGIVSDFFIGSNAGAYSASDFVFDNPATIEYIYTPGFDNTNSLAAQPAINWAIYADAGGVPAGNPEDGTGMASALWAYTAPMTGTGVILDGSEISLDLVAAGELLNLPPGTYWLTVYPDYNVTGAGGARWNWYQAAQVGAETQLISPGIFGVNSWTSLSALGVTFSDTAFRLEGTPGAICDPGDISWLNLPVTSGTLAAGESAMVDVVFDSTGLANGMYSGQLCVATNDPVNPTTFVDVELEVLDATYGVGLHAATMAITDTVGSTVTYTVHITNTGNMIDTFDLDATGTWTTTAPATIELGAGEMGMFYVTVEIPADADDGDSDMATVTATSQGDNTESNSVMLTTTAEVPVAPPTYGVELHAVVMAITDTVGSTVTYTVHVTNTGNFTDTFDMSLAGNDWTTTAPMSVMLGAGETAMAYVTVEIPADAADGDSDMVTITATSQGDDSVMASVMLTTTASEVPGPTEYTSYLPIVVRP